MALASLYNIPVDDRMMLEWSFANMDEHRKIAAAILAQYNQRVDLIPLDPITLGQDLGNWLYAHQAVHDQQNAVLGIAGNDLTTVDLNDISQRVNWIQLHADEHRAAATMLGLT